MSDCSIFFLMTSYLCKDGLSVFAMDKIQVLHENQYGKRKAGGSSPIPLLEMSPVAQGKDNFRPVGLIRVFTLPQCEGLKGTSSRAVMCVVLCSAKSPWATVSGLD